MMTIGRLRPGVTMTAATATRVFAAQLDAEQPDAQRHDPRDGGADLAIPFGAQTYMLPAIGMLGVMGVLILLVVCANVANLVLVRGVSRRGELAVRVALGASRGRLLRLLFVENLVLAIPGALGGVVHRRGLGAVHRVERVAAAPRASISTRPSMPTSDVRAGLSGLSALVFGFVPAAATTSRDRPAHERHFPEDGRARTAARDAGRVPGAVSLVLLVGAGLVLRSYAAARHADGGFDSRRSRRSPSISKPADMTKAADSWHQPSPRCHRVRAGVRGRQPCRTCRSASSTRSSRDHDRRLRAAIRRRHAFLYNVVGPNYFQTLCASPRWPAVNSRAATTANAAGGDRQRDPGAADLADAGECDRQTVAQGHR